MIDNYLINNTVTQCKRIVKNPMNNNIKDIRKQARELIKNGVANKNVWKKMRKILKSYTRDELSRNERTLINRYIATLLDR